MRSEGVPAETAEPAMDRLRYLLWPLGGLFLLLAIVYAVLWQRTATAWHHDYLGLSAALEAVRQGSLQHPGQEDALQSLAAGALGLPGDTAPHVLVAIALHRLAGLQVLGGLTAFGPAGVVTLMLMAALAVVLVRFDERMRRANGDRSTLQDDIRRLDAIVLETAQDTDVKSVLRDLLRHAVLRGRFTDAVVFRFHPERADDCLEPFVYQGARLPVPWRPVPTALVDPSLSGIGRVLAHRTVWRSRDERVPPVPGWDVAAAEVHPLVIEGRVFGVLMLLGPGDGQGLSHDLFRRQVQALIGRFLEAGVSDRMTRARDEARQDAQRLAQLTHELRTPLGLIKGYAATLEAAGERLTPTEVKEFLQTILEETERLESRVNEVLTMAAWDAEGMSVVPRLVHLAPWMDDLVHRFPPVDRLRFQVNIDPAVRVWADADKLRDAITNIIQNAVKYSKGGIEISAGLDRDRVRIAVRDHGPGVAERDLLRIFDRFYRSHRERPDVVGGTGLGLSIARAVALAHHGAIHAENAPRGGLLVVLNLPLADLDEGVPHA